MEITIPINNRTNSKRELFKNISNILSPVFKTTERETELMIYILEEIDYYIGLGNNLQEAILLANKAPARSRTVEKMGFQPSIYRQMVWKLRSRKILGQKINDPHPLYLSFFNKQLAGETFDIVFKIKLPINEQ